MDLLDEILQRVPGPMRPGRNHDCARCVKLKEQLPALADFVPRQAVRIQRGNLVYWTALCRECADFEKRQRESLRRMASTIR